MVITLKLLVLLGGLVATITGFAMLVFFERFMKFNDYVNRTFFVGNQYTTSAFGVDSWLFGKSFLIAVILIIVGLALLTEFVRYAPY
jgi:putative effector of murein hydrolase